MPTNMENRCQPTWRMSKGNRGMTETCTCQSIWRSNANQYGEQLPTNMENKQKHHFIKVPTNIGNFCQPTWRMDANQYRKWMPKTENECQPTGKTKCQPMWRKDANQHGEGCQPIWRMDANQHAERMPTNMQKGCQPIWKMNKIAPLH